MQAPYNCVWHNVYKSKLALQREGGPEYIFKGQRLPSCGMSMSEVAREGVIRTIPLIRPFVLITVTKMRMWDGVCGLQ